MIIEELVSKVTMKAPSIILALGIFILFWIGGTIFKMIVRRIMDEKSSHANISQVLSSIVKNLMLIVGLITALGTLGVNISAIVAGLGLTGFAFKDMLSNFISGVLIFIYEPFKLSDTIKVEGKTGKVININLRYVTIEAENQKVLIPNSISVSKIIAVKR